MYAHIRKKLSCRHLNEILCITFMELYVFSAVQEGHV
jgi:hypothetical protein